MSGEFDIDQLYAALDQKRESLGLSWSGVAREIENRYTKVASSTIKGIREKQYVEGDGVLQMLLWLQRSPESFVPGICSKKEHELYEPLGKVLRWDVQNIYRLLDEKRLKEGLTWEEVSEQIGGHSVKMLTRFRKGGRISFPGVMRIARWLNVPAKVLTKENPW